VIAKPLGISVHDQLIVDNESHASFKGLKLIWPAHFICGHLRVIDAARQTGATRYAVTFCYR
jgi:hypothetical protein